MAKKINTLPKVLDVDTVDVAKPNNQYIFVPFNKKSDIFLMTLDVKDTILRVGYTSEVTPEGFRAGFNHGASLQGAYYHAVSK